MRRVEFPGRQATIPVGSNGNRNKYNRTVTKQLFCTTTVADARVF
jgi:hypothetical protein